MARGILSLLPMIVLAGTLTAMVAGVSSVLTERAREEPGTVSTLSDRIAALSASLDEASSAVSEIEEEIAAREQLVADLEQRQQTYEELSKLTPQQVQAVAAALREEIAGSRSFWDGPWGKFVIGLLSGGVLFIAGIVTERWRARRKAPPRTRQGAEPRGHQRQL